VARIWWRWISRWLWRWNAGCAVNVRGVKLARLPSIRPISTTARAVLKDSATRKQVHLIQEHLIRLSGDFDRFRKRMDNLSKHIQQANKDVEEVNTSARKISSRFEKIEKVELHDEDDVEMLEQ
jgi:DNA recombination protein RmuC